MENEYTQIIILAAGMGKRMQSEEPKALTLYKGTPFIEHILHTIALLNLKLKPIIVVGYKKERIIERLGKGYKYVEQKLQLGTGDAVKSAQNAMTGLEKNILVISADQPTVSKETLENILTKHKDRDATITLGTVIVPDFMDWKKGMMHFGRIIKGVNGSVKKIIEFKDATEEERNIKELNLALYAFDAKWLWENINKLENKNTQGEYYLTDLVKIAFEQNQKIESVPVSNIIEGIHPNSKEELQLLEKLSI